MVEALSLEANAVLSAGALELPQVDMGDRSAVALWRQEVHAVWRGAMADPDVQHELESMVVAGVNCLRITSPTTVEGRGTILYYHGGGYVLGDSLVSLPLSAPVAHFSTVPVISVDYRLAPEAAFPAAIEDCLAVYAAVLEEGDPVALFGDSAGGALALSVAVAAREAGLSQPSAIAAIAPFADATGSGDTVTTLSAWDPSFPDPEADLYSAIPFYAVGADLKHPWLSPLFADLSGLPPLLIQVGGREILASDAFRLARSARSAGVDVILDVWDGLWHVWQAYPIPEARMALEEVSRFLADHLWGGERR